MRKLSAFLAVLMFCAAANATSIRLTDEGTTISATPGQSITLTLTVTGGSLFLLDAVFSLTGNGTFTGGMNLTDCTNYGWEPLSSLNPIITPSSAEINGTAINMMGVSGVVGYATLTYNGGTVIVSVRDGDENGPFGGTYENTFFHPVPGFSTGVVTIVPEPVTLVLLGLGGLFIRRRK